MDILILLESLSCTGTRVLYWERSDEAVFCGENGLICWDEQTSASGLYDFKRRNEYVLLTSVNLHILGPRQ